MKLAPGKQQILSISGPNIKYLGTLFVAIFIYSKASKLKEHFKNHFVYQTQSRAIIHVMEISWG
jgi:hypothetical protein